MPCHGIHNQKSDLPAPPFPCCRSRTQAAVGIANQSLAAIASAGNGTNTTAALPAINSTALNNTLSAIGAVSRRSPCGSPRSGRPQATLSRAPAAPRAAACQHAALGGRDSHMHTTPLVRCGCRPSCRWPGP